MYGMVVNKIICCKHHAMLTKLTIYSLVASMSSLVEYYVISLPLGAPQMSPIN